MKIDLHTHTVLSGHAFGTVQENARIAKRKGISLLATTDHGPALLGSACETYFKCGDRIPKIINGVRVLFGVEANIIKENGDLDLPDRVLKKLDLVIVGLHKEVGYNDQGIDKNTEVLIKAMENQYVKIVSHPYGVSIPVDIDKVTHAAIKNNVLLELNASYFFTGKINNEVVWSGIKTMIKILKDNGKKILINSDAHSPSEVGRFEEVIAKFKELGINKKDILNYDKEEVLNLLNIKN